MPFRYSLGTGFSEKSKYVVKSLDRNEDFYPIGEVLSETDIYGIPLYTHIHIKEKKNRISMDIESSLINGVMYENVIFEIVGGVLKTRRFEKRLKSGKRYFKECSFDFVLPIFDKHLVYPDAGLGFVLRNFDFSREKDFIWIFFSEKIIIKAEIINGGVENIVVPAGKFNAYVLYLKPVLPSIMNIPKTVAKVLSRIMKNYKFYFSIDERFFVAFYGGLSFPGFLDISMELVEIE